MKIYSITCDASGLLSSARKSFMPTAGWRVDERLSAIRTRGGALVAPKQTSVQGTALHVVEPRNVDFPYIRFRARAQDLTT